MSARVTLTQLEGLCRTLNGGDIDVWTRDKDGNLVATIDAYYIDGAYGGVSLYRITSEGGGSTDVFDCGHVPKADLYMMMRAYIAGITEGRTR